MTVRIGTLMPTPRVSVPQITLRSPAWARRSTSRRYLGSIPAWWTPMPWRTWRATGRAQARAERDPPRRLPLRGFFGPGATEVVIGGLGPPAGARRVEVGTDTRG